LRSLGVITLVDVEAVGGSGGTGSVDETLNSAFVAFGRWWRWQASAIKDRTKSKSQVYFSSIFEDCIVSFSLSAHKIKPLSLEMENWANSTHLCKIQNATISTVATEMQLI